MAHTQQTGLQIGHPAPSRHAVEPGRLLFALFGAPIAWMGQLLVEFATTSYVCYTGQAHLVLTEVPGWLQPLLTIVNLLALLVGVAALVTGLMLLRRTREEHSGRSGGIMDAGEGRTRFLAVVGLFAAAALTTGILANTFSLFVVPLCRV